jgi:hypothetical protein
MSVSGGFGVPVERDCGAIDKHVRESHQRSKIEFTYLLMKNWNSYRLVYQSVFSSKIHINTHEPYKK